MRRTIPRNRLLRLPAFLFYTGSAGGVAWCVLLFAATMLLGRLGYANAWATNYDVYRNLAVIFGYVLCCCLTVAFLRFALLRRVRTTGLPVLAVLIAVATWLAPYLVAFFSERNWNFAAPWYLLGSPAVLSTNNDEAKNAAMYVLIGWLRSACC